MGTTEIGDFDDVCNWDKTWSSGNNYADLSCGVSHCSTPLMPPSNTNLRLFQWTGDPIPVNQSLTYKCKDGMKFDDDVNNDEFTVRKKFLQEPGAD